MRIVKLADLSEEERKKVLEEQQQRINENKQASEQMQRQANESFNNLISKEGEFKTSNKTTIGNITKAYKNTNNYNTVKNSLDSYYNQNKKNTNMWDAIKDRTMFIANKTGAGVLSGTFGIGQGVITDTANNMKKGEKEDSNELIKNLVNSFSSQSPTDYMMKNLPNYAKKQIESLKDKDKNGIEKAVSFVNNAVSEVGDSYNNKLGVLSELAGKISPNTSEKLLKANNKISEPINEINNQLDRESEEYGAVANTIANVGQAVGNMAPSILSSVITKNPNVGLATMGLSSKGQSTQEALNKGAELDKAVKIGNTKAMIEVGTEMLTGGVNIFGKGALDDITEKGILNKVKSNVGKVVAKQGLNVAGETLEETISDILGTAIDKGTVNPNAKYSLKDWKDTAVTTTLTTLVLNSLGIVGDVKNISKENKANQNAQKWLKEAESIANKNNSVDLQPNDTQSELKTQEQQIIPFQDKNTPDSNIGENTTKIKGYHGTDENFDNFDLKYFGKHDQGDFGKAVYFSDNENTASKYGKNVKQQDIELNNPYVINTEEDYKQLWSQLAKEIDISKLDKTELKLLKDLYTSQEEKKFMLYDKLNSEEKANAIQKLGYDGVIDNTYGQIAVFNTDKINNIANNQETLYNNIDVGEVKNVPTEEVLKLKTDGGYRDKQQMESLRKDIQENGIKNPIELFKNKDGSIEIENGNHRLQIAKELGIEEVPVKFVESWDNIGIKNTDNDRVKKWEAVYNENNENRTRIDDFNERTEFFKGSMDDNRNQLRNGTTTTANDRLFDKIQENNDRASSNSTFEKDNQGLEKSSSFNLPIKEDIKGINVGRNEQAVKHSQKE